jgi:hypothetical protein
VQAGDTLQSIAALVWGDASMWYLIADANGLSGAEGLAAGRTLTIPDRVTNVHNNAATFRPYDPARALGNLDPTTPKPVKNHSGCGVVGQLLIAVIAIAVAVALPELAPGVFGGFLGGIGAAVVGSVVSQGVGIAIGAQDSFSFKAVALAALSAGVGAGVGQVLGKGALLGSQVIGDVARGALSSAVTQGIAVATGLQDKFDWVGVAAAGLEGAAAGAVNRTLAAHGVGPKFADIGPKTVHDGGFYTNQIVSGMAGLIANAGSRSLMNGSDFGDNVLAALPEVLGRTVGNLIAFGVQKTPRLAYDLSGLSDDSVTGGSQLPVADSVERRSAAAAPAAANASSGSVGAAPASGTASPGPTPSDPTPDDANTIVVTASKAGAATKSKQKPVYILNLSLNAAAFHAWVQQINKQKGITQAMGTPAVSKPTFSGNSDVQHAQAITKLVDIGGPDTGNTPDLNQFLLDIKDDLANLRVAVGEREKFVTVGRDAAGQLVVTSVQVLGESGGNPYIPAGTLTMAHTHFPDENQMPANLDNSYLFATNKPSYVIDEKGGNLFEIGRYKGLDSIRLVNSATSFGPWERFHLDYNKYNIYSMSKYPPGP